jgi:hypothetical protein
MNSVLIYFSVPFILSILYVASKRAKPIKTTDGGYLLQYSTAIKTFAIGFILLAVGFLTFLFVKEPIQDNGDFIAAILIFILFTIIVLYFYIEIFTVKIWVSPLGIKGTSGWRGQREYRWPEIEKITYSRVFMWFKVSARNKSPLRVPALISGVDQFRDFFKENVPKLMWVSAEKEFSQDKRFNK